MALELSMAAPTSTASAPTPATASATVPPAATATAGAQADASGSNFLDSAFVSQLLESVDVDQNDPLFQAALAQINQASAKEKGADEKSGEGAEDDKNNRKRKGDDGA